VDRGVSKVEVKVVEALLCPLGILVVGKERLLVPFLEKSLFFAGKMLLAKLFRQGEKEVEVNVGNVVRVHRLFRLASASCGAER
jgi:hypothetical protein